MKKLVILSGTMGVGKTAVGRELALRLPACAFLDGDWCWTYRRELVNEETKALVEGNIIHMLRGYLRSQSYENIVFAWVLHRQEIWDAILRGLEGLEYKLHPFVLMASKETFRERFLSDVVRGMRRAEDLEPAWERMGMYDNVRAERFLTDQLTPGEAAEALAWRVTGRGEESE